MPHKALPGFRDFYPDDLAVRAHIVGAWREAARRFGFEEYDGPPLEPLELYTTKSGDEIVGQLYAFADKGGREVALRPEMTPTLARLVGARANGLKKPVRWFAVPQLFRYERQQRGRLREHFQFNADLIGEAGPLADVEVIALAIEAMRLLGLGPADVQVRLSDRALIEAVLKGVQVPARSTAPVIAIIDKSGRASKQGTSEALREAGLSPSQVGLLLDILGAPDFDTAVQLSRAAPGAARRLLDVRDGLKDLGLADWVRLDLSIVRGLAYYTGTVFELFDAAGELRAICGGGRYDALLESLGGPSLPAVGFGMGDVVLGELLRERGLLPVRSPAIDVFVAAVTPEDEPHARQLAAELRAAGLAVEYGLATQPVGKQLKLADARNAPWAVVIGPDDRARGEVQLKDLGSKEQRAVPRPEVTAVLRASRPSPSP